ncbi:hypothetical protein [Campylobacter volucris]|uniref:hypothetical protein n=1 Tax=Campylobacter volucris TaxID=1031542 RepID=UPI00189E4217|nr:hypothetical protein [Campylobacter volucris]MBF7044150.1 hypothetical protein [Campylobacter volucris]
MNDFKNFLGVYNICARFTPGFLCLLSIYILLGFDIEKLETNSIFYIGIFVILSSLLGFLSSAIIKEAEQKIWRYRGNPTINYLKNNEKDLYKRMYEKIKNDKDIMTCILKSTRDDTKLFWKNVSYGFFRNSILLSLLPLYFSYKTDYFLWILAICILIVFVTFIMSRYYAQQAIESYKEIMMENNICQNLQK